MKIVVALVAGLTAATFVAPAIADSQPGAWNGLPDRLQVDTGYFRLTTSTTLSFDGSAGSGDVALENDLGVPDNVDTFWIDGTWRVGRRHQLKLGYTRLNRDRAGFEIRRDFTWGGETYPAGFTADTSTGADILGGYYRFAAFRNDRFEIGPTLGVGYLWLDARIRATGSVGGRSRSLDAQASTGSITGAVGGYANAWLAKRLAVSGDFLYIKVSPGSSDASVTDWRVGANYYFVRHAGLGVQYKYYRYSYDRGVLVSKLGGDVKFEGVQAFLTFRF